MLMPRALLLLLIFSLPLFFYAYCLRHCYYAALIADSQRCCSYAITSRHATICHDAVAAHRLPPCHTAPLPVLLLLPRFFFYATPLRQFLRAICRQRYATCAPMRATFDDAAQQAMRGERQE